MALLDDPVEICPRPTSRSVMLGEHLSDDLTQPGDLLSEDGNLRLWHRPVGVRWLVQVEAAASQDPGQESLLVEIVGREPTSALCRRGLIGPELTE